MRKAEETIFRSTQLTVIDSLKFKDTLKHPCIIIKGRIHSHHSNEYECIMITDYFTGC